MKNQKQIQSHPPTSDPGATTKSTRPPKPEKYDLETEEEKTQNKKIHVNNHGLLRWANSAPNPGKTIITQPVAHRNQQNLGRKQTENGRNSNLRLQRALKNKHNGTPRRNLHANDPRKLTSTNQTSTRILIPQQMALTTKCFPRSIQILTPNQTIAKPTPTLELSPSKICSRTPTSCGTFLNSIPTPERYV